MLAEFLSGGELFKLAFLAGGLLVVVRALRKDLNGLGKRVREDHTAMEFRALTVALTEIAREKDENTRKWLAEKFLDGWRRP